MFKILKSNINKPYLYFTQYEAKYNDYFYLVITHTKYDHIDYKDTYTSQGNFEMSPELYFI